MNKIITFALVILSMAVYSSTPISTAVVNGVSFDTTVATNDTITLGRNELSIPVHYSSSLWNNGNPSEGVVRITVDDESVFETEASEGVFNWTPLCAGTYRLSLTVGSVNYQKFVQFMAPMVYFAREGYSSCRLTASDGVSPIRYTTDGSDPTESSTLYTGPFEILPSKWTTVKARTFGEGYLPGEICSEIFGKAGSTVSRAETAVVIDNRSGVRNVPCEAHALKYDVTWEGDDSSRVTLSADGEKFAERTGSGEIEWMPTREGLTTLSLKTLNESGTLEGEYTATFYVWPSEIIVTNGVLPLKEQLTGGIESLRSVVVPEDVSELCSGFFEGCTGLKSVTLPLAIFEGSIEHTPQVEKNSWIEDEDGVYQSNDINDSESTSMTLEVEGPCDFSFDWKVSSEGNYDKLKWYVDGSQISESSGTGSDWQTVSYSIPEGSHTIRWEYSKDGSVSNGDDCGWVRFTESVSASMTISNLFHDSYTAITNVVLTGEGERIPSYAFAGCSSLENVEIPESVTRIGTGAFNGCVALADDDGFLVVRDVLYGYFGDGDCVAIPDGVVAIEAKAFYECDDLTEVIIPSTVRRIGAEAFANCTSLERVVIPNSVTDIGNNAFSGCNSIKDATLPGWKCGINFSNVTNLVIAEGTTNIANYAFQSCYSLESVTIPDSVTSIGDDAFSSCSSLASVTIPDSVTSIGHWAFGGCSSLTSVTIGDGVTSIGHWAFEYCSSLTSVTIPDSVTSIGEWTFYGCSSLTSVTIGDGVTSIGYNAFNYCENLRYISLPIALKDKISFEGCPEDIEIVYVVPDADEPANVTLGDWYEALVDDEGCSCARWETFWMGANVAIPVMGLASPISDSDVIVTAGTYSEFSTPYVLSEAEMWNEYCAPVKQQVDLGNVVYEEEDDVWANWETEDYYAYELADGIWPDWEQVSGRQWILIPTGVPRSGTHTFSVKINGVEHDDYLVSFELGEDQEPVPYGYKVSFNPNGGMVSESERIVAVEHSIGELPTPTYEGYEFLGWFTANEGGERILANRVISTDMMLYARWKEIPRTPSELFGGEWEFGIEGTAETGGYKDSTVSGGISVKFSAEHTSEAWIETEVTNACLVTFSWKADCEDLFKGSPYDYLSFEIDGVRQGFVCGQKNWQEVSFDVSGKGVHRLRWRFCRDASGDGGADCAWLANVEITRIFTVEFARGDATSGDVPDVMEYYEGESVALPGRGSLVRDRHTFAGWSDGTDIYQAGEEYSNDSDTTFTPVWTRNLLQKPVISAPSVFEADTCTVEIAASDGAEVRYTLDGTDPTSGSILYSGPIVISGTTTVKAIAIKDNHFDSDVSVFVVTRGVWTFGEYLNSPEYTFVASGDASWTRAKGVSADGYALRSGKITHGQRSGIEMTVNGAGVISFDCRVEGEIEKGIVWDGLGFYIDGVRQGDLFGNDTWDTKTFTVTGSGKHTLSWMYEKDIWGGDGNGEDCAWLDKVVWSSAASSDVTVDVGGGKSVVVPMEWIDSYKGIVSDAGGDKAAALQRTAANGRKVWECFMLGVDPTKADDDFKITRFWMEDGKPMFEFSHSTDGAGNSFVSRLKVKGKAKLSDGWSDVPEGGNSAFRFFTVEVELP